MNLNVIVMHAAYKKFGVRWVGSGKGIHKAKAVEAVADSGCQTCSAGGNGLE